MEFIELKDPKMWTAFLKALNYDVDEEGFVWSESVPRKKISCKYCGENINIHGNCQLFPAKRRKNGHVVNIFICKSVVCLSSYFVEEVV
jgi:hypothetical protein